MRTGVSQLSAIQRALNVSYVSAAWGVSSGALAVAAGIGAHSAALVGTGADVLADLVSTLVLIWRFRLERSGHPAPHHAERRAQITASTCLVVVAVAVGVAAVSRLVSGRGAHPTGLSVGVAAASVAVLPAISWLKYRAAEAAASRALRTDGHIGIVGATTAALTLLGLAATSLLGWKRADPVAALVVVTLAGVAGIGGYRTTTRQE